MICHFQAQFQSSIYWRLSLTRVFQYSCIAIQYVLPLTTKNTFSKDIGIFKLLIKLNEAIFSETKVKKEGCKVVFSLFAAFSKCSMLCCLSLNCAKSRFYFCIWKEKLCVFSINYNQSTYIFLNAWYLTLTKGYSPKVQRVKNVKRLKLQQNYFKLNYIFREIW